MCRRTGTLTDIQHLGFKVLCQGKAGPKKVKLLSKPWPTTDLPPASATLLSVASKLGLLAAAGPGHLVVTSTEGVRKAFQQKTLSEEITDEKDSRLQQRDLDIVTDFTPDVTLPVPTLRHVVFSTDGDFLVISSESNGGLAVFDAAAVAKAGKTDPEMQIETGQLPVRALLPNPTSELAHFFAVVLESGRLMIVNVADGTSKTIRDEGVNCVAWSTRGKALVAGLQDGTCAIHMNAGDLRGVVPCPPEVGEGYVVTGLSWLNTQEFLIIHSAKQQDPEDPQDSRYHVVKSNKGWTAFTFHSFSWDPLAPSRDGLPRALPPRFSATRLREWEPDLQDMLVVTNSHTDAVVVFASTSNKISPDQENCNEFMLVNVDDTKKAAVPRTAYGDDTDSVFIGEALDLSSNEKILRPIPALEEINEAPWPLPAYMGLTHEGVLAAWWIVWNRSVEAGTRYPGLTAGSEGAPSDNMSATPAKPAPQASPVFGQPSDLVSNTPTTSGFGKPTATFGTPATPQFGNAGFGTPTPALMKPTPPGFGTPGFGSTAPTFGKPAQPAFGAPSAIGAPSVGFGSAGGMGNKSSPWGAPSQPSQSQANPFSSAASGSSGFAKFGQTGGTSTFSSFGSNNGTSSGFASLGQSQQKPAFSGLKPEPSFGSTVTVGSGTGSTLPSWSNTPAQQSGSLFSQSKSSFNTSSFESKESDMSDVKDSEKRTRDDATPTPQAPPSQQSQGLFGLAGGFKLGTTFSSDGTAKDDPAKPGAPASGSFFGSDFSNMLGPAGLKQPATPLKETPTHSSTTPASPPKQQSFFPSTTPAKDSATPKAAPPAKEISPVDDAPLPPDFTKPKAPTDDAPLPPDFISTKAPKSADDDLPPLAGSPGIKVEAPSSSPEPSPLDDHDNEDGFSDEDEESEEGDEVEVEEQNEEDEDEQTAEPHFSKQKLSQSGGWSFQDSVNNSPRVFPPAPTPPANKSGATSQSGRSASPAQPLFGQPSKPPASQPASSSSLFSVPAKKAYPFPGQAGQPLLHAQPSFPALTNRAQDLRSPSPVRSASTSAIRPRREPLVAPGSSLSASIQAKPPTPQPQVSDLEDEEDERMREELSRPIEPSRTLDEFVAYQNYTGKTPNKSGHAAQIEMLYKDINGMVDALGWNARSMKSFTQYHAQPQPRHEVDRQTLEEVEDEGQDGSWFEKFTLCEIAALKALGDELEQELDAGRVQDVLDKLAQLARLLREKAKLMTRLNDIRRQIITRKDPDKVEALRKAPLSKELADGQKSLRNVYAQLLTSLHKAEDAASILRTRLASQNAQNGKTGQVPTMDAVKRTVMKLAVMAEKKNNDILLLEAQLRKFGLTDGSRPSSASSRTYATPRRKRGNLRASIGDSPYTTPPTNRSTMSLRELNRRALTPDVEASPTPTKGYGLYYIPEGSPSPKNQLAHIETVVNDQLDVLRATARRRKVVAGDLKKALIVRGVKTTRIA